MPITADDIAAALNTAGIDTAAELDEWAKSLKNKGPELEKIQNRRKRLDARFQNDLNARQQRRDELSAQLDDAIRELEAGEDPTGPVPTNAQVNEIAPQDPFTPTP